MYILTLLSNFHLENIFIYHQIPKKKTLEEVKAKKSIFSINVNVIKNVRTSGHLSIGFTKYVRTPNQFMHLKISSDFQNGQIRTHVPLI